MKVRDHRRPHFTVGFFNEALNSSSYKALNVGWSTNKWWGGCGRQHSWSNLACARGS